MRLNLFWKLICFLLNFFNIGGSSTASTKSATIEMYVGSSYNDTMSGETLSSISEKSETYISANGNATTVLTELPSSERSHYARGTGAKLEAHHKSPSRHPYSQHSHTLQHPSRHRHPQSHQYSSYQSSVVGISSPSPGATHNHHHMHLHPPTSIGHSGDLMEVNYIYSNNTTMPSVILS